MGAETEWILVTLLVPETYGAWIVDLRDFLGARGRVFVSIGTSSLVVRRIDFRAAALAGRVLSQSERFYRIRPFDDEAMGALLGQLPVDLMPQMLEEMVDDLARRTGKIRSGLL